MGKSAWLISSKSFNPRTREGCDLLGNYLMCDKLCFNPRTREGCDPGTFTFAANPARFNPRTREGCDFAIFAKQFASACFNPRTREGCDDSGLMLSLTLFMFQSTHPRGVRRAYTYRDRSEQSVSIHAPARGATAQV